MQHQTSYGIRGYTCPGCDVFSNCSIADADDLVEHTLSFWYTRDWHIRDYDEDDKRYCPWCRVAVASLPYAWWEANAAYDAHLKACSKYKLCCIARCHPQQPESELC